MKTISSRFLKGALAMLLAVIMVFGTTVTGFAAVVDKAETGVNTVAGGYVYFDNTKTKWTDSCIQFVIGHSSYSRTYTMSKISNTNLYYVNLSSSTYHDWGDATYYAVIGTSSKWGDGSWGSSNLTNATHRTAAYTTAYNMDGDTKRHLVTPTGSSNGTSIGIAYQGTTYGSLNKTNYVYVKSAAAGSTTYNNDSAAGTAKITGYYLSANSTASSHSATTTLNSSYTSNCTIAPGTTITLTASPNTGYKFVGWYTSGGTLVSSDATCTTAFSGATTYHARFEVDATYYSVSYDANGGTGAPAADENIKEGDSHTISSTEPTMEGHTFREWNTSADGTGTAYAAGATIDAVNEDITLYAQYDINTYTIKFDVNGGSGTFADMTKTYGVDLTLPTDTPTAADGDHAFAHWNTKADGSGDTYLAGATYTANAGTTLYAQYARTYAYYTFVDYDGTTVLKERTRIAVGNPPVAPATPTRDHYDFKEWTPSVEANITGDKEDYTYTAVYTPVDYTITLNTDGGTVSGDNPITYTIESEDFPLPTPTKDNHDFLGWDDGSGNVSKDVTITKGTTGNKTYTATWQIHTNTVSVSANIAEAGTVTADKTTVEHGGSVTLTATLNDGYRFDGWYEGDTKLSADLTCTVTNVTTDKTFVAKYTKIWSLTVNVPDGVSVVEFGSTGTSTTHTYTVADGVTSTYSAEVEVGWELVGWEVTKGTKTETFTTTTVKVTVDDNTTITPLVSKLYNVTVSGATAEGTGYHGATKSVTVTFNVPTGQYVESVSIALADSSVEIPTVVVDKDTNTATFTMPACDVTLTPTFGDMYKVSFSADVFTSTTNNGYYRPGADVTINVTPKGGHLITSVTSEQTEVTYADKVITFTMPAEDVVLDVEYQASFKAYAKTITVHIDRDGPDNSTYDNTVQGGTVSMTCNDATVADGGFVDGDITYTATVNTNYQFVGFFADKDCTRLLSTETTYTASPEGDITVYALYARKQYIKLVGYSYYEMTYDYKLKAYTYDYTDSNLGTAFNNAFDIRVTYDKNHDHVYSTFDGSLFQVTMNENALGRTISWGSAVWNVNAKQDNTTLPMKLIVKPGSLTQHNKIDVSAQATKIGYDIFLSSGRYKIGDATTTILTDGVTGTHVTPGGHNGDNEEYKKIYIAEQKTISWELEIGADNCSGFTADDAAGTYVDSFVVYKMRSKTFEIVTPVELGNNKYQGTVIVNEDCYIVPVFFHTDAYRTANDLVAIELYFDTSAIQHLNWGPFVAAYAWGTDEYFGEWPGQMLIPSEDGKSFYTELDVPSADSDDAAAGITFNNYLFATCPTCEQGSFGLGSQNVQTYDYREAITLYEAGYEVITFVAKDSEDGYHGDSNDGSNTSNVITTTTTGIKDKYVFDYLYCRDGVTPMDFTGKPVTDTEGAVVDDLTMADYYVVAKGDVIYSAGNYSGDDAYNGDWCVDWYIFDSTGAYKTKVLSTALWHDLDTTDDVYQTVLMTALGLTPETAAGKTVAISYEASNNCPKVNGHDDSHQLAYDGQWYGSMLDTAVKGEVIVGLDDGTGNFIIDTEDPTNDAVYGVGYLKDLEGGLHQSLDIKLDYGIADLTATPKTDPDTNKSYRFIGWYTKKADGSYVQISNSPSYSTYINMNETYYAIFREIGEVEVVINHRKYVNDDAHIPSHDGVGELSIEVRNSAGEVVATGPISTSSTTATFEATEGQTYTVKIITTPLMKGKFFAWYTDSYNADGTETYEEVLTEPGHIGSTSTVTAEFEYTYDTTNPDLEKRITIYSDINRVSNKATLKYKYTNRNNEPRVYTVKDVLLSDDECLGFVGNDEKEYCPAYRTLCTFITPNGDEWSNYFAAEKVDERIAEYEAQGYTFVSSSNRIQELAPSEDVTQAFNQQIVWKIEDIKLTFETAEITISATQAPNYYTIKYEMNGKFGNVSGAYNDLVQIEADGINDAGHKFAYWVEILDNGTPNDTSDDTEVILTYLQNYRYRIVENKSIKAVYLPEIEEEEVWTPSINSVTITREYHDDGDIIYNDYLLAFNNNKELELNEVKEDGAKYRYGLMLVRDKNYFFDGAGTVTYVNDATIQTELEDVARGGASTTVNDTYNVYCYELTKSTLTNLNRIDYILRYDNSKIVSKTHYYREYAFTAVPYVIDVTNNKVYLGNAEFVNFYKEATAPVESD